MTEKRVCGGCKTAVRYEGTENKDPFSELPEEQRDWLREHCAVCSLDKEWPLVVMLDQDPDDIPCDFWDE